jgi:hypothetical protein
MLFVGLTPETLFLPKISSYTKIIKLCMAFKKAFTNLNKSVEILFSFQFLQDFISELFDIQTRPVFDRFHDCIETC